MNKRLLTIILTISFALHTNAQEINEKKIISQTQYWQKEMNEHFKNPKQSPLTDEDISHFDHLNFYPINLKYVVKAKLTYTPFSVEFKMPTTTERLPRYKKYAIASFTIDGKQYQLSLYQNLDLLEQGGHDDYLFMPFVDLTSGDESYGGGRYIDLEITDEDYIIINFNLAYNPYCAYNERYSCPIPPKENSIDVKIEAGVKKYH